MNSILISIDCILLLFLVLIYIGASFIHTIGRRLILSYNFCLLSVGAGILVEMLCYAIEGNGKLHILLFVSKLLSDLFIDVTIFAYMSSIFLSMESNGKGYSKKLRLLITLLLFLNALLEILLAIAGKSFRVEGGLIINGPLAHVHLPIQIFCFYCVFTNAAKIGGSHRGNPFVLFVLAIVPYLAVFIMYRLSVLKHCYIFFVFAYMIMYITMESTLADKETERANIYKELSVTDILTGFLNHTGYQEYLKKLSKTQKYGVIFCDVNSLKMTNDTEGHEAGDVLIKNVAEVLKESLIDAKLCRVSGDEFVCISELASKDAFKEQYGNLKKSLFAKGRIASCGYAVGKGEDIVGLIKDAEKIMYKDKERYYKETGRNRRRT